MTRGAQKQQEEAQGTKVKEEEIELLRRELDLVKRERDFLERSQSQVACTTNFSLKDLVDIVPKFTGTDITYSVEKWLNDIEENAILFKWTDTHKLVLAKKLLDGTAKLWLQGENIFQSWNEFKDAINKEFPSKTNTKEIHQLLNKQKKKTSENLHDYILRMKEIGKRADLAESVIIEYIVDGIEDYESNKIILYGCNTFVEFKEKIKLYEKMKEKSKSSHHGSHKSQPLNNSFNTTKKPVADSNSNNTRCFNCGKVGHKSKDCSNKAKGFRCFVCNQFGHKSMDCTKNRDNNSNNEAQSNDSPNTVCLVSCAKAKRDFHKLVNILDREIDALIDTGSSVNLMKAKLYLKLGAPNMQNESNIFFGIGNNKIETLGKFSTNVTIDESTFSTYFHIVPDEFIPVDVLIGKELLQEAQVLITENEFTITKLNSDNDIFLIEQEPRAELNVEDKRWENIIKTIIEEYEPNKTKDTEVRMKIILSDDNPVYQSPRRLPYSDRKEVERQLDQWLEDGIIRPSSSDYASPIVLVKKKNGSTRICVDYRKINKKIIKDRYPLPLIEEQVDNLRDSVIFSTLDLKNGFFHVPVSEESQRFTAFVTHVGQFEFLRTPFGLCNSPAVFQRFINNIFKDLIANKTVLCYLDDLIIPAKDYGHAIARLEIVMSRCSEYGLQINFEKCKFLQTKIDYLGYIISKNSIMPSDEKTKAIKKYPEPKNIKQIESFLGLTGYFRKFIPQYSLIAKPLSDLKKKDAVFKFGPTQKNAFETLKNLLSEKPVLKIFDFDAETELHTDASQHGYGAVLLQRDGSDQQLHPVYFMSRKTTDAEKRYSSYELEVLAVIEALKKFRIYLLGIKFKIYTDCSAFTKTMEKRDLVTRVARWALLLEEFNYEIFHRPGIQMKHVDALSRNPVMFLQDEDILTTKIAQLQNKDDKIKTILKCLEHGPHESYVVKNNLLYKQVDGVELLVVPKGIQTEIIRKTHENGHFSVRKVQDLINREFYIPNINEKIQNVVQNCVNCILGSAKRGKQEGFLEPIMKEELPLQTYHIDHLGPLPSTKKSYNYLFNVVDAFTKFVWVYPTKGTTSDEVLGKLNLQKQIFGNPRRIVTDRGTAFTSAAFKNYCQEENIQHLLITTGVPRGNGQIERINQTIIAVLTKLSIDKPTEWFKHVNNVQRVINSTVQRSINNTPFKLLFGVEMRSKEDIRIRELLEEESVRMFQDDREEIRRVAKEEIQKIQKENKRNFDRRRKKARQYEVGDLVSIKRTQFGPGLKLHAKYLGPYQIKSVKSHNRYDVVKVSGDGPNLTTSAADYMKPWADPGADSESSEADDK